MAQVQDEGPASGLLPVADVQQAAEDAVATGLTERPSEEGDEHRHARHHERQCRYQAPDSPSCETAEVDPSGAVVLAHQSRRDEEAAEGEEQVDSDETAGQRPRSP